jgi:hypothetical protein
MSLDPRSPSMNLWHRLLAAGVTEEEATTLMHGYAHELAEQIRDKYGKPRWEGDEPEYAYGYNAATHDAADLIDPQAQQPPVDEYRMSTH